MHTELSEEEVTAALRRALQDYQCPVRGQVIPGHANLEMPPGEQRLWSPRLSLSYEAKESGGVRIRGLYGPAPGVWTLFMFLYTTVGFGVFLVGLWGMVLISLGEPAPMLWMIPLFLAGGLGLWLFARLGQQFSRHQRQVLHRVFCRAVPCTEAVAGV
jgi:hypothetical protein